MPKEIYEVIAQGARYWFLFLMLLIVWRSYRWYRRDKKQAKKRLKLLPDAGYVGEMVVVEGGDVLAAGDALPVPCEGTLGSLRTNDLCVPIGGVDKRHLWFRFDEGRGLMVEPFGKNAVNVDGEDFVSRREPLYMAHGSRLYVGDAELRLRLFAGFEGTAHAARPAPIELPDEDADGEKQSAPMLDSAAQMHIQQQWMMRQQWLMQQQMQQMAQQQAYQRWLMQQAQDRAHDGAETAGEYDEAHDAAADEMYAPAEDERMFMRPEGEAAPAAQEPPQATQPEAAPTAEPEDQPYASSPSAQEAFEELYAPDAWDEDMTDAALPPKSAYVGHDEAEHMKRKLWDKYFGGGREA